MFYDGGNMREIKFRYWDVQRKGLYEIGDLSFFEDGDIIIGNNFPLTFRGETLRVLEQYTGLKDKNGKEIYEGDIVECCSAYGGIFKAEIVFQDGCFEIQEPQGKDGVFRDYLKCLTCNHAVSVIGNIYENPELLSTDKIK